MTSQQPKLQSQSGNFLGFLSQQPEDLSGKTTLAHEFIQNADDAKDSPGRLAGTRLRKVVSALRMEAINPAPTMGSH